MRAFGADFLMRVAASGLLLGLAGCVEPYVPAVVDAPASFLVVDGFLNGNGVTRIKLSRTANLSAAANPPVEKGASLFIVDETSARYALAEKTSGSYQSDSLLLNPARQYKLRITTTGSRGATYESALVPLKVTPAIDKLDWKIDGAQLQVRLNTHDPSGQSRYYRWGFIETWEFNSAFKSFLEYDNVQKIIVDRTTPIYTCWRTERPSLIKQGSSAQLSQDALTNFVLFPLSTRAERLKIRYSVLVSQYAQTAEEFAYYELLRKNTEAVGSPNDPLPTQLTGNVRRLDKAAEPVLGYVGAHTIQQKRLFISRQELPFPNTWQFDTPYASCMLIDEDLGLTKTKMPNTNLFNGIDYVALYSMPGLYIGTTKACADCRTRGVNTPPSFW